MYKKQLSANVGQSDMQITKRVIEKQSTRKVSLEERVSIATHLIERYDSNASNELNNIVERTKAWKKTDLWNAFMETIEWWFSFKQIFIICHSNLIRNITNA